MKNCLHESRHGFFNIRLRILTYFLFFGFIFTNCSQGSNPNNEITSSPKPEQKTIAATTLSSTPTKQPPTNLDEKLIPLQSSFRFENDKPNGQVDEYELDESLLLKINTEAKLKWGTAPNIIAFNLFTNNNRKRPFIIASIQIGNIDNIQDYMLFSRDADGKYFSVSQDNQIVFLPLVKEKKEGANLWGFDIGREMLYPPLFVFQNGSLIFIDPITLLQVEISRGSLLAQKIVQKMINPFGPKGIFIGQKVTSDLIGRDGITQEMVGTIVTTEGDLPFRFLSKPEGKRIAVFLDGEWGKYLDVKIPNLLDTEDIDESEIIKITPEEVYDGTWRNMIMVETFRLGLDKQNIDPNYIFYKINDYSVDKWNRSALEFDYSKIPNDVFQDMISNTTMRPTYELFFVILEYPDGKKGVMLSSRFSQRDSIHPFSFFNMAISGDGKIDDKKFVSTVKSGFFKLNIIPATTLDQRESNFWKGLRDSGYFSNIWEKGYYGVDGSEGTANIALKKLVESGLAPRDIEKMILFQGSSQNLFSN